MGVNAKLMKKNNRLDNNLGTGRPLLIEINHKIASYRRKNEYNGHCLWKSYSLNKWNE